ncbi:Alpha-L-arabinofuranosidase, C-terminal [Comamonadaceae bacterium]
MKRRYMGLGLMGLCATLQDVTHAQAVNSSPAGVRVRIALDAVGHTVSPNLFGTNLQWENVGDGALLNDTSSRIDPFVLDSIKETGVSLIRFPGGDLSNTYRWQNGIGPRAQRKPGKAYAGNAQDSLFGSDELLALTAAAKVGGLITVNASQDVQEAANWVDYLNGAKTTTWGKVREGNGFPSPLNVRYWEVGNEVYSPHQPGFQSAQGYADTVKRFARAMKARDPSIKVGAALEVSFTQAPWMPKVLPHLVNWNETVLREAGQVLDFVVVHFYAPHETSWNDSKLRSHVLAAPEVFQKTLKYLVAQLQKFARPQTEIVMSEFGTAFAEKIMLSSRIASTEGALFNASLLFAAMREPRVTVAAHWSLINNSKYGMAVREGQAWVKRPVFEVYRLLKAWQGAQVLGMSLDTPTYAVAGLGSVPAMDKVPLVDGLAVRLRDGSIGLGLLNRSDEQPLPVQIDLAHPMSNTWRWERTCLYAKPNADRWERQHTSSNSWNNATTTFDLPAHSITWLRWVPPDKRRAP